MTSHADDSPEDRQSPCTIGGIDCLTDGEYFYFRNTRFPACDHVPTRTWVTKSIQELAKFDDDAFSGDTLYQLPRKIPRRSEGKYRWSEAHNAYLVIGHEVEAKPSGTHTLIHSRDGESIIPLLNLCDFGITWSF